jgi:AMMECR1 domain-containing protein
MSPQPEHMAPPAALAGARQNEFTPEEHAVLLRLAHESILSALERREISLTPPSPHLDEPRGAFTTIYFHGNLRGCVGYVFPVASFLAR